MAELKRYAGITIDRMDEDEITQLHERFAVSFRQAGLKGVELDQALSGAMQVAIVTIQESRRMAEQRRNAIGLVKA